MDNNVFISQLSTQHVPWLDGELDEKIVLCTRIRVSRNIEGFPFPIAASAEQSQSVTEHVFQAVRKTSRGKMHLIPIKSLSSLSNDILHERRLISKPKLNQESEALLLIDESETLTITLNEEDHIRIQCMTPGLDFEKGWVMADTLLHEMEDHVHFSYDEALGYLTSCPSNVGTGLKASVLLHLPGLQMISKLAQVLNGVQRLGISIRGVSENGHEQLGAIFQLSNQSTLGESEFEIMTRLETTVESVVNAEKVARQKLFLEHHFKLLNEVSRSYGLLKFAYALSLQEAFTYLSALRLGVDLKLFSTLTTQMINHILLTIQDAHIMAKESRIYDSQELDICRAAHVRNSIRQSVDLSE